MDECKQRVKMWLLLGLMVDRQAPNSRTLHRDKPYRTLPLWSAEEIESLKPAEEPAMVALDEQGGVQDSDE